MRLRPPLAMVLALVAAAAPAHAREAVPPGEGLRLHIRSGHTRLRMLQWPVIRVALENRGRRGVTLVHPRDGGHTGLRTPRISWSILGPGDAGPHVYRPPYKPRYHCGNIAGLAADDLVSLAPGEVRALQGDLAFPQFSAPGRYRVVLFYENTPARDLGWWRMIAPSTPELWSRIRDTEPCLLRSNELEFEVRP